MVISNRISFMRLNFFKIYICYIYLLLLEAVKAWHSDPDINQKRKSEKVKMFSAISQALTLDFSPTSELFEPELSELACKYQWVQYCPFLQHLFNSIVRTKKDGSSPHLFACFLSICGNKCFVEPAGLKPSPSAFALLILQNCHRQYNFFPRMLLQYSCCSLSLAKELVCTSRQPTGLCMPSSYPSGCRWLHLNEKFSVLFLQPQRGYWDLLLILFLS